jgi:hypothetical protein
MLEAARDRGLVSLIGATHYSPAGLRRAPRPHEGRADRRRAGALQPGPARGRADDLPLAGDLGLGVLLTRPLGEGCLVRRAPGPAELEPLRPFGITTWAQALIKWGPERPARARRPGRHRPARPGRGKRRRRVTTLVRTRGAGPACSAWPQRTDKPSSPPQAHHSGGPAGRSAFSPRDVRLSVPVRLRASGPKLHTLVR